MWGGQKRGPGDSPCASTCESLAVLGEEELPRKDFVRRDSQKGKVPRRQAIFKKGMMGLYFREA